MGLRGVLGAAGRGLLLVALLDQSPLLAQNQEAKLAGLITEMKEQCDRRIDELKTAYEARIAALEDQVKGLQAAQDGKKPDDQAQALDAALKALEGPAGDVAAPRISTLPPSGELKLIDLSLDVLFAAGSSSERDRSLQTLEGGDHDPRKRGFTMQNAELSLVGAVDPYFTGEAHIVWTIDPVDGASRVELEEAFLLTQSLPAGLQLKAGQFVTEFGRINPTHPHAWDFIDQPVINTRLFGPDGLRGPGVRLSWLTPLPWFSELYAGVQNANGETAASFLASEACFSERAIGGRPFFDREVRSPEDLVYLVRWDNSWDLSEEVSLKLGASGLYGPNATGNDGQTTIGGLDLVVKWRPTGNFRGWPFAVWQTEVLGRRYDADTFFDPRVPADPNDDLLVPGDVLHDWGLYTQVLCGFSYGWAAGLRYEYATGSGSSYDLASEAFVSRGTDPFGDDRQRWSLLLIYYPSEFSRLRLQYNYDRADHLDAEDAHSVWFGTEILFGKHPAHNF